MIKGIKQKILKKVNEKLDRNLSIEELYTLSKIMNNIENNPTNLYKEMGNIYRKILKDQPKTSFLDYKFF